MIRVQTEIGTATLVMEIYACHCFCIVNTICTDKFKEFILKAQKEREKHVIMKKQMNVKLVPEIAQIIKNSN